MNKQSEFELRYNITANDCDTQRGSLDDLLQASLTLVNPWEIRRPSDNALVFAEDEQACDCGTGRIMRGWRVCLSCAESRLMYPDFWAELVSEPDRIDGVEGVEGVPLAFMEWDLNHLHVGKPFTSAPAAVQEAGG